MFSRLAACVSPPAVLLCFVSLPGFACAFDTEYEAATDALPGTDATGPDGAGTDGTLLSTDSAPPPPDAGNDAGTDAVVPADSTVGVDSAVPDGGLVALGPFGPPMLVATLSDPGAYDDDPTLTADLLEIYWNSNRGGGLGGGDIWTSSRAVATDPWGAPAVVSELSSGWEETTPELAPDGLTIWFSSNRPGGLGGQDVYVSTRPNRMSTWGPPQHVPELASPADDSAAAPSATLLDLVMISQRAGGAGGWDLYSSNRATTSATWSTPVPILELNTVDQEDAAFFSPQTLVIYFTTNRPGGLGLEDLWVATRLDPGLAFGAPVPVAELNSIAQDLDPWLSDDLRYIVFYSTRSGNGDLYEAWR